jgi:hypothetical protein
MLDLSGGADRAPVVRKDGRRWPDLPAFLEEVVLPARAAARPATCGHPG